MTLTHCPCGAGIGAADGENGPVCDNGHDVLDTSATWIRAREDDGEMVEDSIQTVTLHSDRVDFGNGYVVTECPWNPALSLAVYLRSLDYEPFFAVVA